MSIEIIDLARKAGFNDSNPHSDVVIRTSSGHWVCVVQKLMKFAFLVTKKERERCLNLFTEENSKYSKGITEDLKRVNYPEGYYEGWIAGQNAYREAIRNLSKQ